MHLDLNKPFMTSRARETEFLPKKNGVAESKFHRSSFVCSVHTLFLPLPPGLPTQKVVSGRFVPFLCSFHRAENAAERQGRLPRCPGTSPNCNPIPLFIKKRERAERGRH